MKVLHFGASICHANFQRAENNQTKLKCFYGFCTAKNDAVGYFHCFYSPMNMKDSKSRFALDDYKTFEPKDVRGSTNIQDTIHLLNHEERGISAEGRSINADAQDMTQIDST